MGKKLVKAYIYSTQGVPIHVFCSSVNLQQTMRKLGTGLKLKKLII